MKNSIAELITLIETKHNVQSITARKFNRTFEIYPWIKAKVFHKMVLGKESLASKSTKSLLGQFKSLFYGTWNLFIRKYEIWAFTTSVERIKIEGKFTDKLFDRISSFSKGNVLIIEFQYFKKYPLKKVASKYVSSKALFLLSEEIYSRFFLRKTQIKNKAIIKEIEASLKCSVNADAIVKKNLAQYRMMKFWLKILPNPKYVFLTVSYNHYGYIRAFKESGIPVVEFQHGVISANHQAYNYIAQLEPIQFPDVISVFGENENTYLNEQSNMPIQYAHVIGRSIIDHYYSLAKENETIQTISVALQDGPIGNKTIEFLLAFNRCSEKKYIFNLVPRRTSEASYKKDFEFPDNFKFTKENIYHTISHSDVNVTAYSTVAIEALSLGKRSYLINIENKAKEVFLSILGDNPYVHFVDEPNELTELLSKHERNPKKHEVNLSNDVNISSNYKQNCINLLMTLENLNPKI
ncbi:MAG: hypothetical protein L7U23_07285 [Crocinitomicaceae bacterium]|jgi:hypothetical protein|nr:hypothetical protein [Crocinitomicaceae bacterium]